MGTHLQELVSIYGKQALVNLVNQKGHERPLKEAYEQYLAQVRPMTRVSRLLGSTDLALL